METCGVCWAGGGGHRFSMPPARAPADDLHAGALLNPYGLHRDRRGKVPFYSNASSKHVFAVFQLKHFNDKAMTLFCYFYKTHQSLLILSPNADPQIMPTNICFNFWSISPS